MFSLQQVSASQQLYKKTVWALSVWVTGSHWGADHTAMAFFSVCNWVVNEGVLSLQQKKKTKTNSVLKKFNIKKHFHALWAAQKKVLLVTLESTKTIFFIPSNILVLAELVLYFKVFYQMLLKSAVKPSYTAYSALYCLIMHSVSCGYSAAFCAYSSLISSIFKHIPKQWSSASSISVESG